MCPVFWGLVGVVTFWAFDTVVVVGYGQFLSMFF